MSDALNDVRDVAAPTERGTQPLYWSIRRELWENRSLYLAPLAVAAFVLLATIAAASCWAAAWRSSNSATSR